MTKKEKRQLEKYKKLRKLVRQWTKAEIMARYGEFSDLEFIDYAIKGREAIDKIRKLLYGTSDIIELGLDWDLLSKKKMSEAKYIKGLAKEFGSKKKKRKRN